MLLGWRLSRAARRRPGAPSGPARRNPRRAALSSNPTHTVKQHGAITARSPRAPAHVPAAPAARHPTSVTAAYTAAPEPRPALEPGEQLLVERRVGREPAHDAGGEDGARLLRERAPERELHRRSRGGTTRRRSLRACRAGRPSRASARSPGSRASARRSRPRRRGNREEALHARAASRAGASSRRDRRRRARRGAPAPGRRRGRPRPRAPRTRAAPPRARRRSPAAPRRARGGPAGRLGASRGRSRRRSRAARSRPRRRSTSARRHQVAASCGFASTSPSRRSVRGVEPAALHLARGEVGDRPPHLRREPVELRERPAATPASGDQVHARHRRFWMTLIRVSWKSAAGSRPASTTPATRFCSS